MKALAIVYVKDTNDILPRCLEAIKSQTYKDFSLVIHEMKPIHFTHNQSINGSENVVRNRNYVRKMALASDAEYFIWIDGDIIIPPNTFEDFIDISKKHGEKLLGGWYKARYGDIYVSGRWDDNGLLIKTNQVQEGITWSHLIGIGCSMIHRSLLEKLEFRTGCDQLSKDENGFTYYVGDCLAFCEDSRRLGVLPKLVGSIVCEHIHDNQDGHKFLKSS